MMEAAPSAPFIVPEPDFLLELLIVALDAPAQLGQIDEPRKLMFSGSVESQYLVGSASPSGHSISSHSGDSILRDQFVVPDTDAHTREARGQPIGRAFPPRDRAPGPLGQTKRHFLGRDQIGLVAAAGIVQRLVLPPSGRCRSATSRCSAECRPRNARPRPSCLRAAASRCRRRRPSTRHRAAGRLSQAHRICSSAISGLVLNSISFGTPAFFRRARSLVQSSGRYSR